jgi:FtsP/CotA-like multicopper oxidase with cupredoxin domain
MGPLIRAKIGDTTVIHFRNNTTQPYGMHPHGVYYSRDSEGTPYAETSMAGAGLVPPGQMHTYIWKVPERAGPGQRDGSSVVWLYHSHNWEPKDVSAGLIGPMVITRRGMARAHGSPKDVDREFATLFMLIDENQSHYLQHNIDTYTQDPKSVNRREFTLSDAGDETWRAREVVCHDPRRLGQYPYTSLARKRRFDWRTPNRHFLLAACTIRHRGYGADVPLPR